ncbi:MAG: hypothetical protein Q9191_001775 [Dirinaria sp. TL-2023a]
MAYNAVSQGEHDALSDSASSHSASPDHHRKSSRPLSLNLQALPRSRNMSDASRGSYTPLQHPTPDLQALQGAYISNIERLEQSAERLSQSGSDIGEELRKLKLEQKKSESRRSSFYNQQHETEEVSSPPSRHFSYGYGSRASNSIVETNSIARSGGFSPAGYFASPRGSIRSGSWSHHNSIRGRSGSQGLRMTQLADIRADLAAEDPTIVANFHPIPPPPQPPTKVLRVTNNGESDLDDDDKPLAVPQAEHQDHANGVPERRTSAETFEQARDLFEDFDGVHIGSSPEQPSPSNVVQNDLQDTTGVRRTSRPLSYMEPVPGENMVYYPAPVPMMLNLPQKLSKLPTAPYRDKRRTQILNSSQPEPRNSAPRLPHPLGDEEEVPVPATEQSSGKKRDKPRNMADVPPQLRASLFFDYPSVQHDVQLKGESVTATLDSILDASAHAPVSAFTDHPIAGHVGPEVYGRQTANRASNIPTEMMDGRKRKSILDLRKRDSGSDMIEGAKLRHSSILSLGGAFGKRKSSAPAYENEIDAATLHSEDTPLQVSEEMIHLGGADGDGDEFHDAQEELRPEDEDQIFPGEDGGFNGQPTTLLAELQLRKQQQKQRNRQAAIGFPNGMHSTLLQMDAVAQVQKKSRQKNQVHLAWEDPSAQQPGAEDEDNEDVPLGMLYPTQKIKRFGHSDEDRPLGLIARRHLEENETLSERRARLRGVLPSVHTNGNADHLASMYTLDLPDFENRNDTADPDEVEGETLAQRVKRLKARRATTIPKSRPISGDFASEMLSQFGGLPEEGERKEKERSGLPPSPNTNLLSLGTNAVPNPDNGNEESPEETLGQRRKRLQAQREAEVRSREVSHSNGFETAERPPVSKRRSMADILSAHPVAGAGSRVTSNVQIPSEPVVAATQRQTSWARNQQRKFSASGGGMPMAAGIGVPNPLAYAAREAATQADGLDARKGDMIDRWRQSVLY